MASSATYIGYGSGPWSRGSWGEDQYAVFVDGVEVTASLGTSSVYGVNNIPVTLDASTGQVNAPTIAGDANVSVSGVNATGNMGYAEFSETWTGWSSGPWDRGAFGEPVVIAVATGVSATANLGTASTQSDNRFNVTGVEGTGQVNSVIVSLPKIFSITGVEGTTELGQARMEETWTGWSSGPWSRGSWGTGTIIALPSGVQATGSEGSVTVTATAVVSPVGVSASGALGTSSIIAEANVDVIGESAYGVAGEASVSGIANVYPSGVSGTVYEGTTITRTVNRVDVTGVEGTGLLGTASIIGAANVYVSGVQATGQTQTFTLVWGEIDTSQTPNWQRIAA